jgi:hypothetical protein
LLRVTAELSIDEAVRELVWLGDSELVVAAADGSVLRWWPDEGRVHTVLDADADDGCTALDVHPGSGRFAVGTEQGRLHLVDDDRVHTSRFREPVSALRYGPGSGGLLAVAAGHDVAVLDEAGRVLVSELFRPTAVTTLIWLDDELVATGGTAGVTFLAVTGDAVPELPAQLPAPGLVLDLALDRRGLLLAAADLRGEVRVTELDSGDELSLDGLGDRARGVAWFGPEHDLLALSCDDELIVWQRAPHDLEPEPWIHGPLPGPSAGPVACSDGSAVAAGGHDGTVVVVAAAAPWDCRTVAGPRSAAGAGRRVRALAWDRDGSRLAVGSVDGRVQLLGC